jgi:thioredoxin reductase
MEKHDIVIVGAGPGGLKSGSSTGRKWERCNSFRKTPRREAWRKGMSWNASSPYHGHF